MGEFLGVLGFNNEIMVFEDMMNFWFCRGKEGLVFCFVGYIDVVFSGFELVWKILLFIVIEVDGYLYGWGVVDMKGSFVVMLVVICEFVNKYFDYKGSIVYFIISDEEGFFINGIICVIDIFEVCNEKIDWCIVGEFFLIDEVGDIVKNGCRGLLMGDLVVKGV